MIKKCIICGGEFKSPPSANKTTCGKACRSVRAAKSATGEGKRRWGNAAKKKLSESGQTPNLKKGTPAAQKSPIAGARKTHKNALVWTLQTPSGTVVQCRNLNHWLRQVFSDKKTRELARCGIMQIRRSRLGKTKRPVTQWRGYRLIDVTEPTYIVVRLKRTNFYIKVIKKEPVNA